MSISPSKQAAISAYRNLLKTQREVFSGNVYNNCIVIPKLILLFFLPQGDSKAIQGKINNW